MLKGILNGVIFASGVLLVLIGLNLLFASDEGERFKDMELTDIDELVSGNVSLRENELIKVFGTMDSGGNGTGDGADVIRRELNDGTIEWMVEDFMLLDMERNGSASINVTFDGYSDIRRGRHVDGAYRDGDMICIIGYWKEDSEGNRSLEAKVVVRDPDDFYEERGRGTAATAVGAALTGFSIIVFLQGYREERRFYAYMKGPDAPGEAGEDDNQG